MAKDEESIEKHLREAIEELERRGTLTYVRRPSARMLSGSTRFAA
jgi:hypothetical protein